MDAAWYWELVDLSYKLLMAAIMLLLPVDQRGSRVQMLAAAMISFASGCLHVAAWPYRRNEDNILRVVVELEIFMIIVVSMALGHASQISPSEVQMFAN